MTEERSDHTGFVDFGRASLDGRTSGDTPLVRGDPTEADRIEVPTPLASVDEGDIRLLHVDDDQQICDYVETFFADREDRFSVVTETSVVAALDRLSTESVDCVVSDYRMPNTDGLEFLEIVRERYPDLPFILFTGHGDEDIASDAIAAGVTDYMQKGVGTEQYEVLAHRVERAVDRARTREQFFNALSWYQRLVEQELAGVCIVQDGTFVYVNQKLADTFGYDQVALVGERPETVFEDGDAFLEASRSDAEASISGEFTGVRADGAMVSVEVEGGRIEYDGDPAWIGILRAVEE